MVRFTADHTAIYLIEWEEEKTKNQRVRCRFIGMISLNIILTCKDIKILFNANENLITSNRGNKVTKRVKSEEHYSNLELGVGIWN